ncbi:DUF1501 domain-containing protein [Vibrio nomapromontoriensis]|uniref:DUF1501 domain-containing protein n=1 Tax=Vibrio nomapromontoriensis TaxID=2910246 RepID=UPI003D0A1D23
MNRRDFIKTLGLAAATASMPASLLANTSGSTKQFLLYITASGGWDVTYYCDPKENVAGKPAITNWSTTQRTQKAGNIAYAPIGNNANFFEKHAQKICVINGLDLTTVGHVSGRRAFSSGMTGDSHPTVAAISAASQDIDAGMPYISGSQYHNSVGLVQVTTVSGSFKDNLRRAAEPQLNPYQTNAGRDHYKLIGDTDYDLLTRARDARLRRLSNGGQLLIQDKQLVDRLVDFSSDGKSFTNFYQTYMNLPSGPSDTARVIMAAFASGQALSADIDQGGYDTHSNNDASQTSRLSHLNDTLDYIWSCAESLGISDQLMVVVGSEFSRTPLYNAGAGKDHWKVGSIMVMGNNKPWGNRVIGTTDSGHYPHKMNLTTLQRDDENGQYLTNQHVNLAIRDALGLTGTKHSDRYNFGALEIPPIFG